MYKIVLPLFFVHFIEWYDFILFGHLSYFFGHLFFPVKNEFLSLLMSLGAFAVAFPARIIGSILFGHLGDVYGRKFALMLSVKMMLFSTLAFAFLPTFFTIGVLVPILLIILRILQGIAAGGELGGIVLLMESISGKYRTLFCGLQTFSSTIGVIVGYIAVQVFMDFNNSSNPLLNENFNWRIPFIIGGFMTFILLFFRNKINESYAYLQNQTVVSPPLKKILLNHKMQLISACGMQVAKIASFFMVTIVLNILLNTSALASMNLVFYVLLMLLMGFSTSIIGFLAIFFNKDYLFAISCVLFVVFIYPVFQLAMNGNLIGYMLLVFLTGLLQIANAITIDIFPVNVRQTGFATSCCIIETIFGGTTPAISLWLVHVTKLNTSPAFYLILCGVISFIATLYVCFFITRKKNLNHHIR